LLIEKMRRTEGRLFVCGAGPASEFMRMGVKTLLYRAGSEACFLVGDRVLPISKALSVSGAAGGSKLVAFGFGETADGPMCGDE
jgi:hypothetical protein